MTDELIGSLEDDDDASLARLAQVLADQAGRHRGRLVAAYELYLRAIRSPPLRPQAFAWLELIADRFAPELDGAARRAFQATVEGLSLHSLMRDRPWRGEEIEAMLRLAWPRD